MKKLSLAVLAALALGVTSAHAEKITATFTGTVYNTYNDPEFFGLQGDQFLGQAVTAIFTIDDTKGVSTYDPPNSSGIYGGGGFGTPSPVTALITVNGITISINGTDGGQASRNITSGITGGFYRVSNVFRSASGYTNLTAQETAALPGGYDYHSIPEIGPIPASGLGTIILSSLDNDNNLLGFSSFAWTPTSLVITAQGVPEPTTWALMLFGFGGAAVALRRSRSRQAAALV